MESMSCKEQCDALYGSPDMLLAGVDHASLKSMNGQAGLVVAKSYGETLRNQAALENELQGVRTELNQNAAKLKLVEEENQLAMKALAQCKADADKCKQDLQCFLDALRKGCPETEQSNTRHKRNSRHTRKNISAQHEDRMLPWEGAEHDARSSRMITKQDEKIRKMKMRIDSWEQCSEMYERFSTVSEIAKIRAEACQRTKELGSKLHTELLQAKQNAQRFQGSLRDKSTELRIVEANLLAFREKYRSEIESRDMEYEKLKMKQQTFEQEKDHMIERIGFLQNTLVMRQHEYSENLAKERANFSDSFEKMELVWRSRLEDSIAQQKALLAEERQRFQAHLQTREEDLERGAEVFKEQYAEKIEREIRAEMEQSLAAESEKMSQELRAAETKWDEREIAIREEFNIEQSAFAEACAAEASSKELELTENFNRTLAEMRSQIENLTASHEDSLARTHKEYENKLKVLAKERRQEKLEFEKLLDQKDADTEKAISQSEQQLNIEWGRKLAACLEKERIIASALADETEALWVDRLEEREFELNEDYCKLKESHEGTVKQREEELEKTFLLRLEQALEQEREVAKVSLEREKCEFQAKVELFQKQLESKELQMTIERAEHLGQIDTIRRDNEDSLASRAESIRQEERHNCNHLIHESVSGWKYQVEELKKKLLDVEAELLESKERQQVVEEEHTNALILQSEIQELEKIVDLTKLELATRIEEHAAEIESLTMEIEEERTIAAHSLDNATATFQMEIKALQRRLVAKDAADEAEVQKMYAEFEKSIEEKQLEIESEYEEKLQAAIEVERLEIQSKQAVEASNLYSDLSSQSSALFIEQEAVENEKRKVEQLKNRFTKELSEAEENVHKMVKEQLLKERAEFARVTEELEKERLVMKADFEKQMEIEKQKLQANFDIALENEVQKQSFTRVAQNAALHAKTRNVSKAVVRNTETLEEQKDKLDEDFKNRLATALKEFEERKEKLVEEKVSQVLDEHRSNVRLELQQEYNTMLFNAVEEAKVEFQEDAEIQSQILVETIIEERKAQIREEVEMEYNSTKLKAVREESRRELEAKLKSALETRSIQMHQDIEMELKRLAELETQSAEKLKLIEARENEMETEIEARVSKELDTRANSILDEHKQKVREEIEDEFQTKLEAALRQERREAEAACNNEFNSKIDKLRTDMRSELELEIELQLHATLGEKSAQIRYDLEQEYSMKFAQETSAQQQAIRSELESKFSSELNQAIVLKSATIREELEQELNAKERNDTIQEKKRLLFVSEVETAARLQQTRRAERKAWEKETENIVTTALEEQKQVLAVKQEEEFQTKLQEALAVEISKIRQEIQHGETKSEVVESNSSPLADQGTSISETSLEAERERFKARLLSNEKKHAVEMQRLREDMELQWEREGKYNALSHGQAEGKLVSNSLGGKNSPHSHIELLHVLQTTLADTLVDHGKRFDAHVSMSRETHHEQIEHAQQVIRIQFKQDIERLHSDDLVKNMDKEQRSEIERVIYKGYEEITRDLKLNEDIFEKQLSLHAVRYKQVLKHQDMQHQEAVHKLETRFMTEIHKRRVAEKLGKPVEQISPLSKSAEVQPGEVAIIEEHFLVEAKHREAKIKEELDNIETEQHNDLVEIIAKHSAYHLQTLLEENEDNAANKLGFKIGENDTWEEYVDRETGESFWLNKQTRRVCCSTPPSISNESKAKPAAIDTNPSETAPTEKGWGDWLSPKRWNLVLGAVGKTQEERKEDSPPPSQREAVCATREKQLAAHVNKLEGRYTNGNSHQT